MLEEMSILVKDKCLIESEAFFIFFEQIPDMILLYSAFYDEWREVMYVFVKVDIFYLFGQFLRVIHKYKL